MSVPDWCRDTLSLFCSGGVGTCREHLWDLTLWDGKVQEYTGFWDVCAGVWVVCLCWSVCVQVHGLCVCVGVCVCVYMCGCVWTACLMPPCRGRRIEMQSQSCKCWTTQLKHVQRHTCVSVCLSLTSGVCMVVLYGKDFKSPWCTGRKNFTGLTLHSLFFSLLFLPPTTDITFLLPFNNDQRDFPWSS